MKWISLLVANLVGSAIISDIMSYVPDGFCLKSVILLIIAAIAFFAYWTYSDEERSISYYGFVISIVLIVDILILDDSAMDRLWAKMAVLTSLNMFIIWLIDDILISPSEK